MIRTALLASAVLALPAHAAPSVVTDVPPVHSIVARVMEGIGAPVLIVPPGASAHSHSMRPSEAGALAGADMMIWVGPSLTPWLKRAADALAPGAERVTLLDAAGVTHRALGEHAHGDGHGDAHAQDGHEDHDGEGDAHDGEAHGEESRDPHAWLDPLNGAAWMDAAAAALSAADPANAETYAANAAAGRAELEALAERLAGSIGRPRFAVAHDAYGHFEDRFGISAMAEIADSGDAPPGAARVRAAREEMAGAACILTDPGSGGQLAAALSADTGARLVEADPLGGALEPGPALYPALIEGLAETLRSCG